MSRPAPKLLALQGGRGGFSYLRHCVLRPGGAESGADLPFADGVGAVVGGVAGTVSKTVVDMPVAFPDLRRAMADKGVAGQAQRQRGYPHSFPRLEPSL